MNVPNKEDRRICPECNTCHARPHCDEQTHVPMQLQAFPLHEPWTREDTDILASVCDEAWAEYLVADDLAASSFAQCRHISSGNHNSKLKHTLLAFRGVDPPKAEADQKNLRRTKRTLVGVTKGVMLALVAGVLQACTLMPSYGEIELEHVSHPLSGFPVTSNTMNGVGVEDGLSQLNLVLGWRMSELVTIENGIGYNLQGKNGGGFYGPALTYTGRVKVRLFGRQ